MKIQLKDKDEQVLYELSARKNSLVKTLEQAVIEGVDLAGVDLSWQVLMGLNLEGARMQGAILTNSFLYGASLVGADLRQADCVGADFRKADLTDVKFNEADLYKANFARTNLWGAVFAGATIGNGVVLRGDAPILQIGPIGSRRDILVCYDTSQGPRFSTGCQQCITEETFRGRLAHPYCPLLVRREYEAAFEFFKALCAARRES